MRRALRSFVCLLLLAMPVAAGAQPPTPAAQDEFVPISEIPPQEQIPAITLVASAYGFVWLAVVAYVWSLGRRIQKAEADLARLERKGP